MAKLLTADGLDVAVATLRAGRLVAFPTETVYGLGADVASSSAVRRIFEAKGRPAGHPLIAHVGSVAGLQRLGRNVGPEALALAEAFWPGPLTVIVQRGESVAPEVTGGRPTVGVRMPDHPLALELLTAFDGGIAGPSANRFGGVSPTTAQHVIDDLGDVVDVVLDGGACRVGLESTIVDTTGDQPVLLRPGGVPTAELETVLGRPVIDGRAGPSRASGMLASHYAPAVTVRLVEAGQLATTLAKVAGPPTAGGSPPPGLRIGIIGPDSVLATTPSEPAVAKWSLPDEAEAYGRALYATLRDADRYRLDLLMVVPPGNGALLDAVLDRLSKAAGPRGGVS